MTGSKLGKFWQMMLAKMGKPLSDKVVFNTPMEAELASTVSFEVELNSTLKMHIKD